MKVAIQGIKGCFHQHAAMDFYKDEEIEVVEKMNFPSLLDSVVDYESDCGVIAVENTVAGTILGNLNLIRQKDVKIVGEVFVRISQNLAVLPGTKIEDLTEVHSHYMAINQTRKFFNNYPNIRLVESPDTAYSIKKVKEDGLKNIGAIGGKVACDLYGLDIIASDIETNKKNYTRFFVVKRSIEAEVSHFNKASLSIILPDFRGSLSHILVIISFYGIDLTKIESLPIIGQPFNYMFYLDIKFDDEQKFKDMLSAIRPLLKEVNVLGTYLEGGFSLIHEQKF